MFECSRDFLYACSHALPFYEGEITQIRSHVLKVFKLESEVGVQYT